MKMIKRNWIWVAGLAVLAIGCSKSNDTAPEATSAGGSPAASSTGAPAASGGYAAVQAIFTKNCVGCHGLDKPKGGISLTNYAAVIKGGTDGPIVNAGDP